LLASKLTGIRRLLEKGSNAYWYDFPFGNSPRASKEIYLQLAEKVQQQQYPEIDTFEQQVGYSIEAVWLNELALHTQVVIKESPLCYAHGRVLYSALSQYIERYKASPFAGRLTIWETGTARGFSSLCMAKALSDQQQSATIVTFDVLPHRSRMYWNCIDDHERAKTRAELLEPWSSLLQEYVIFHQGDTRLELPKVQPERIHFAFLDGAHTYEDVMFEFETIKERQRSGDMIVYDDYTPSQFPGLVRAVDGICQKYGYQRTNINANAGRGYVVAVKE